MDFEMEGIVLVQSGDNDNNKVMRSDNGKMTTLNQL